MLAAADASWTNGRVTETLVWFYPCCTTPGLHIFG